MNKDGVLILHLVMNGIVKLTLSVAVSSFSSGYASRFGSTCRFQRSSCTISPSSTCDRIFERGSSV